MLNLSKSAATAIGVLVLFGGFLAVMVNIAKGLGL